ncbi:hypothetical protein ATC03_05865 [Agromyces aureus]|uniref:Uncharacterized protein n=1 Tax=Agromyces aureus TaxID=453304 RepID=A0A191WDR8_9MICO|nr:hypothetical protein ATC03_05865 [Agromyces aureus]
MVRVSSRSGSGAGFRAPHVRVTSPHSLLARVVLHATRRTSYSGGLAAVARPAGEKTTMTQEDTMQTDSYARPYVAGSALRPASRVTGITG